MDTIIVMLDFVLIVGAGWAIWAANGLGGIVGKSFNFILGGMILLGLAHLSETITFEFLHWSLELVELTHRLIVLGGFVLLTLGFQQIQKLK